MSADSTNQQADVERELIGLLEGRLEDPPEILPATELVGDLGLESIQIIEYLCEVEDRYDLMIDEDTLADVRTIADLAAVVRRLAA